MNVPNRENAMNQGSASASRGQAFNAMPERATGDCRLQTAHYRTLLAIAFHDRRSFLNGGQACWASVNTLARETHLHRRTVLRAIADLVAWGYLTSERRSQRRRHLAIVYDDPIGDSHATNRDSIGDSHATTIGDSHATQINPESDCAEACSLENYIFKDVETEVREIAESVIKRMPPELRMTEGRWRRKRDEMMRAGERPMNGHAIFPQAPIQGSADRLGLKPAGKLG